MRWLLYGLICLLLVPMGHGAPLRKVRVQFNWAHQFEYAGFYMAKEKGYYRQAGLEVVLNSLSTPDQTPLGALKAGRADFIVSNTPALAAALNGEPWVMVANYFKRSALVWLTRPDIKSPFDLNRRKVGMTPDKRQGSMLSVLLNLYGAKPQWAAMTPTEMLSAFKRGELAAMPAYLSNEPIRLTLARQPYNLLEPWRFGLEALGDSVFTRRAFADAHPDLVRAFVSATNRGWQDALAHPDEAVALILAKYNELNKSEAALKLEAHITALLVMPERYPIGSMPPQLLRRVGETLVMVGMVDRLQGIDQVVWQGNPPMLNASSQSSQVVFCNDPNWIPIDYVDRLGHPQGIAPDYVRDLFKRFLPEYTLKYQPSRTWPEAILHFEQGRCDLLVEAVETPVRKRNMLFSEPYLRYPFLVITRQNHAYVERMEQLEGQRIARQKGSALIELLKRQYPKIEILETENTDDAFKAVAQGRADAVLAIGPVAQHALLRLGLNSLVINGVLPLHYDIRMAVSPKRPALLAAVNRGIMLYPEADLEKLKARYTAVVSREPVNRHWIYIGIGIFLLVLGLLALRAIRSRQAQKAAEHQAQVDALTGAFNRHGMHHRLPHMLALTDEHHPLCIMMFDLDHFKQVNDTYGHQVGDEVLKFLVKTISPLLRNTDLLVRWGGEEFLLFCPGTPFETAVQLAERLRKRVAEAFVRSQWPEVTISIGVTQYRPGEPLAETLARADMLLYRAKANGRNRVETDLTPQKEIKQDGERHADHDH